MIKFPDMAGILLIVVMALVVIGTVELADWLAEKTIRIIQWFKK